MGEEFDGNGCHSIEPSFLAILFSISPLFWDGWSGWIACNDDGKVKFCDTVTWSWFSLFEILGREAWFFVCCA